MFGVVVVVVLVVEAARCWYTGIVLRKFDFLSFRSGTELISGKASRFRFRHIRPRVLSSPPPRSEMRRQDGGLEAIAPIRSASASSSRLL